MIIAIKSHLTPEKLKLKNFYKDNLSYWSSIPEIMWHYFICDSTFLTDKVFEDLKNDKDILEFNIDANGLSPNISSGIVEVIPENANFNLQWGLKNVGQYNSFPGIDTRATEAWTKETGSFDIIVAVIDAGVDVDHQCLLGHIYIDPRETITVGLDADNNSYRYDGVTLYQHKNDFIGWNFAKNTYESYTSSHGTAIASIITTNGTGMSGVTMRSRVMPVAIMNTNETYDIPVSNINFPGCGNRDPEDDTVTGSYSTVPIANVAKAIIYAANKGAHIIELAYFYRNTLKISCCGTYPVSNYMPDVRDAIYYAGRQGCIVVSSAGDTCVEKHTQLTAEAEGFAIYGEQCSAQGDGVIVTADRNCFPGSYTRYYDFMLNVTAHDGWGYLYYDKVVNVVQNGYTGWMRSCCWGKNTVDIAAPGKDILVAMPNNAYGLAGGTSVASAFVAGAAALVWSRNPYLKNKDVVDIITASAAKDAYWATRVSSSGRLDIKAAIDMVT